MKNALGMLFVLFLELCLAGAIFAKPRPDLAEAFQKQADWPATVNELKKFLQIKPGQRATGKIDQWRMDLLKKLSIHHPLEFDWVEQDLHDNLNHIRDFYFCRTPEIERRMLDKVFGDLGRKCPEVPREEFLATHRKAASERREKRLARLKELCGKIVFTRHFNLGGSHYAYTEALSDAQGERWFIPGAAL